MVNVTTFDPARAFTTISSTFCTLSMAPTLRFSLMVSLVNQEWMVPSRRISSEGNLVPRVGVGAKLGMSDGLHMRALLTLLHRHNPFEGARKRAQQAVCRFHRELRALPPPPPKTRMMDESRTWA
jgi:hypothetical protein